MSGPPPPGYYPPPGQHPPPPHGHPGQHPPPTPGQHYPQVSASMLAFLETKFKNIGVTRYSVHTLDLDNYNLHM